MSHEPPDPFAVRAAEILRTHEARTRSARNPDTVTIEIPAGTARAARRVEEASALLRLARLKLREAEDAYNAAAKVYRPLHAEALKAMRRSLPTVDPTPPEDLADSSGEETP